MIEINLSKQQTLNADPKAIQHINFTGNLEQQVTIFYIIGKAKKLTLKISLNVLADSNKKMSGSGTTTLTISNEEMTVVIKIVKILEESGLLIKALVKQ